ncbi:MAG: DAK2 domain-containing protein [Acidimicrobiia bacterium]
MSSLEQLAGPDVAQVVVRFRDALRSHQEELNRMNVYPVPDGDTGTNMALTLESVCTELGDADRMPDVCRAVAHGSLMGARGNSGVILSQVLRGLADTFSPLETVGGSDIATGLRRAADAAYAAVLRPIEGTILTVVRESAEAAEHCRDAGETALDGLLEQVRVAADAAVLRTPELLPVLKENGVVDAGGKGFTLLLDAMLEVVAGRPIPEPQFVATPKIIEANRAAATDHTNDLRYEVMYFLEADDTTIPAFRDSWGAIGDSIVVVGGDGTWNCHVHTDDIGAAVEAGIDAGRPYKIRVTDLIEQVGRLEEEDWVQQHSGGSVPTEPSKLVTTAVVAVGVGDGVRRLLSSLGVQQIVAGGQSMNPSTAQILEAVEACPADSVIVLPNNTNIVPVASKVADLTSKRIAVIPTLAVIEGLAALIVYDPDAPIDTNVQAMEEAVGRVNCGAVTQAVRDSIAECGRIAAGDWIAIDGEGIQASVKSPFDAARVLLDSLIDDDRELVTLIIGADAPPADTARITEYVADHFPQLEIEVHHGGQPLYPYLIGVE